MKIESAKRAMRADQYASLERMRGTKIATIFAYELGRIDQAQRDLERLKRVPL